MLLYKDFDEELCKGFAEELCMGFAEGLCKGFAEELCMGFAEGLCKGFAEGLCMGFAEGLCEGFAVEIAGICPAWAIVLEGAEGSANLKGRGLDSLHKMLAFFVVWWYDLSCKPVFYSR